MKGEKGLQVGLPALEEITEKERQYSGHDQKDDDEHIGERSGKIACELTAKDGQDVAHCCRIKSRTEGRSRDKQISLRLPVGRQPTDLFRGESRDTLLHYSGLSSSGNVVSIVTRSRCGEMDPSLRACEEIRRHSSARLPGGSRGPLLRGTDLSSIGEELRLLG